MRDVARRAGVSIATVSTTFARPNKVRLATQDAVRQAAAELGYVPNASAQGLVNGRTQMIGVMSLRYVVGDESEAEPVTLAQTPADVPIVTAEQERANRFWGANYVQSLHRGMQLECGRRNLSLVLGGTDSDAELGETAPSVPQLLSRVDGLATLPWAIPPGLRHYRRPGQPVVAIFHRDLELSDDSVLLDGAMGMRALVAHLAQQHGRKRFLFVGTPSPVGFEQHVRREGFEVGIKENQVSHLPHLDLDDPTQLSERLSSAIVAHGPVDAVMCATDRLAEGVLSVADTLGWSVPTEVSVTGVDGDVRGTLLRPALTSIRGSVEQLGATAVKLICERLADPDLPRRDVVLPVSLIIRSSCGC